MSAAIRRAVVLASGPGAAVTIGGLPLAVRTVLALGEAGFADLALVVAGTPRWAVEPLSRRGIRIRWLEPRALEPPDSPDLRAAAVLLLTGDALIDAAAASVLREAPPGPVRTAGGQVVGVVCEGPDVAGYLGRPELWARCPGVGTRLEPGWAVPFETAGTQRDLERALFKRLAVRQAGDSYLAALIDRPLSRPVTRLLLRTPLTPSHVTLLSVAVGLLGAAGLATVSYWGRLGGVLLLVLSVILDCVDGDMARARHAQDPAGARLDVSGDYVVHLAVFAGLSIGLLREGLPPYGAWAALTLLAGVGAAMLAVHVLFIRPALERGGDLHWAGDAASLHGRPGASIVEKLASRDYTYLLLVLAAIGRLEWFLYAAAGGAWLFTGALLVYRLHAMPGARPRVAAE